MKDYLEEFSREELISLIHGLLDTISGRVWTMEEVERKLKLK